MNEIPDLISRPGSFKGGAYLRGPQQLWHMAGREIVRLWVPAEQMMTVRGSGKPKRYMAVSTQGYCTQFTSRRIAEPVSLGFIVVDDGAVHTAYQHPHRARPHVVPSRWGGQGMSGIHSCSYHFQRQAQSSNLFPIPHFPSLFQRTTSPNLWDSTLSQVSQ